MSDHAHVMATDDIMTACSVCGAYFEAVLQWSTEYQWWFKVFRPLRIESEEQAAAVSAANFRYTS